MPTTLTRSMLVILIPGVVAAAPWMLVFGTELTFYLTLYRDNRLLVQACLFALVVLVGSLFEGINTHLETRWDRQREKEFDVVKNWHDYLALVCQAEPVAFKYMSRIATTMYFELSMIWASSLFGMGLSVLLGLNGFGWWLIVLVVLVSLTASAYFLWQARRSHEVLCVARRELNSRIGPPSRTSAV